MLAKGVSLATDAQGRLIGHKADYEMAVDQTLVTSVPMQGKDTAYTAVGDLLAYLSALVQLSLIARFDRTAAAAPAKGLRSYSGIRGEAAPWLSC